MSSTTVSGLTGATSGYTAGHDPDAAVAVDGHPKGMRVAAIRDPVGREASLSWVAGGRGPLAAWSRQFGVDGNVTALARWQLQQTAGYR